MYICVCVKVDKAVVGMQVLHCLLYVSINYGINGFLWQAEILNKDRCMVVYACYSFVCLCFPLFSFVRDVMMTHTMEGDLDRDRGRFGADKKIKGVRERKREL